MTQKVVEALKISFANTYVLYNKFQSYHWNLTGPHFFALHNFFEEVYTKLAENIDALAERIRFFDKEVPVGLSFCVKNVSIKDAHQSCNEKEAVKDLISDQEIILKVFKNTLSIATENNDIGTESLLTDLITYHEKILWLLKSNQH